MMNKPSARLRKAIELINKHGWTQGTYRSPDGCFCASGALQATGEPIGGVAYEALLRFVDNIPAWNDSLPFDSGKATVLATMGKAASELEEQGQ